mmetsp:Transcript_91643/g.296504  ORF Transcript_91643/g.296504 Transcript_91643/m.296504 type:complete len:233 (-) Transcript_91643:207-905(-)
MGPRAQTWTPATAPAAARGWKKKWHGSSRGAVAPRKKPSHATWMACPPSAGRLPFSSPRHAPAAALASSVAARAAMPQSLLGAAGPALLLAPASGIARRAAAPQLPAATARAGGWRAGAAGACAGAAEGRASRACVRAAAAVAAAGAASFAGRPVLAGSSSGSLGAMGGPSKLTSTSAPSMADLASAGTTRRKSSMVARASLPAVCTLPRRSSRCSCSRNSSEPCGSQSRSS